jgi:glycosyltransferase involved in cell wall biosynthesis
VRILVLTSTFPRWAGDREPPFVFELSRRLAAEHDVLVLAPHCRGAAVEERLAERLRVRRFRYAPESLESLAYEGGVLEKLRRAPWRVLLIPLFLLAEVAAAARAIRRERPDVIHAHWIVPQGAAALLGRALSGSARPAIVCTSHGADLFALRGRFARAVKSWVVRRAAALTVVSRAMKAEAFRLGAPEDRVKVMPMGVDARERFVPAGGLRDAAHLLFVGRLVRKKGVADLLEALAVVRKGVPEARLTVVGSGPLEHELRAQARALGLQEAVTFAGAVPNAETAEYYRRASVLVMPSVVTAEGDQEGLGLVMAEALACECPVVASDLPAISDLIEDSVTGLIARQGDPRDLAEKIVRILREPARAALLAREGRARVLARFDWQGVGRGYLDLLAGTCRAARP